MIIEMSSNMNMLEYQQSRLVDRFYTYFDFRGLTINFLKHNGLCHCADGSGSTT